MAIRELINIYCIIGKMEDIVELQFYTQRIDDLPK